VTRVATKINELARELRAFTGRREIINATSRGIRNAVKPARVAIKAAARSMLPKRGGLNVWVSKIGITASIKLTAKKAGVKLKGGRNAQGGRSDMHRIDADGRVRAPSWGRKTRSDWHNVSVTPGFFTRTAAELPDWVDQVDAEIDGALDKIRR
jgi:hypothetical protein